jgi:hydroxymethylpyrimidine kinase/phosphomethylpyrimidine kinase
MPFKTLIPASRTVLCIGGLDPSGGAGISADARACAAFGAHCLPVATAIAVQNTRGVKFIEPIATSLIQAQIETILDDISPSAIKIGLIPSQETAEMLADLLRAKCASIPLVIDTVFAPSTGPLFSDSATIATIADQLLPHATVVTPNALEARQLGADEIFDEISMKNAARAVLARSKSKNVLLKGGHVADPDFSVDLWFDGAEFLELRARRENSYEVRGTGCLLASALAAQLAIGIETKTAAQNAKGWLTQKYFEAQEIGGGRRIAAI